MTPSGLHEPVRAGRSVADRLGRAANETSTLRSLPPATNATKRLSGDQIGRSAPSVPARGRASSWSSERTQIRWRPPRSSTSKAIRRPSGDTAGVPTALTSSGIGTVKRTRGGGTGARRAQAMPSPTAARDARANAVHAARSRTRRRPRTTAGRPNAGAALRDPLQLGHHVLRALPAVLGVLREALLRPCGRARAGVICCTLAIAGGCVLTRSPR